MAEANGQTDAVARGKVTEVCRAFLASADEGLARRLQDEEYGKKYERNREARKVARMDVPLAKSVHSLEEEKQQKERFDFLQQQSRLTEKDAEVALQLQKEEENRKALTDSSIESNDAKIALEMQKEEVLGKQRDQIQQQLEDQALAERFQEEERRLAEMKTMEREVREQRRLLELEMLHEVQTEEMLGQGQQNRSLDRSTGNRDTIAILAGVSEGYRLSGAEFLSEQERHEVMKMQDEELARALQDHEEKKAQRARHEIAADIEQRDYQLAQIMQQMEKLELAKRQYQEQGGAYASHTVTTVEPSHATASHVNSHRSYGSVTTTRNVMDSSNYSQVYVSASSHTESADVGSPPGNDSPVYAVVNRSNSQQSSTRNITLGSTSSSDVSSSPQSPSPTTSPPPPPPPPPLPPPHLSPPLSTNATAEQGPLYATVTRARVAETNTASHPASPPRDNSHVMLNNQAGSRISAVPVAPHEPARQVKPSRRPSSRDKSCKQQ